MKIFAVLLLVLSAVCYADTPEEKQDYEFQLLVPIRLYDGTHIKSVKQSEIDSLRDKIYYKDGLLMQKRIRARGIDGYLIATVRVKTPREFKMAVATEFYVSGNTIEYSIERSFDEYNDLLNMLEVAKPAKKSFITDVGIDNLELLPIKHFYDALYRHPQETPPLPEEDREKTFQDKVDEQEYVIKEKSKHLVRIIGPHTSLSLHEKVRADFDGDGIEDVWLNGGWRLKGGTHRGSATGIFTRKSPDGKFEPVQWEGVHHE